MDRQFVEITTELQLATWHNEQSNDGGNYYYYLLLLLLLLVLLLPPPLPSNFPLSTFLLINY